MKPGAQAKVRASPAGSRDPDFHPDGQLRCICGEEAMSRKSEWTQVGDERTDFDPEDLDEETLEGFFEGKPQNRNFLFYHLGDVSDGTEKKVRVNGKWWPKNTQVHYPNDLKDFKKTTMVCREGKWEIFEDRVAMGVSTPIKPHWQVDKCCVFALPKRYLEEGNEDTAFFASIPALSNCATMSKKQRATFRRGAEEVAEKDGALRGSYRPTKTQSF